MFSFSSPSVIHFGRGQSKKAAALAKDFGTNVLIVHGATAARAAWLLADCRDADLSVQQLSCGHEPSIDDLERALTALDGVRPDVVIALGGGSVIDMAKALAALIPCAGPCLAYLEIVGDGRPLDAAPIPMIAVPTTAGTGAEVTKNAVISVPDRGIKVSLRDARMIPDIAIVDAGLMQGAPRRVTLAAGLDAVTQVIEPFLSCKSNLMSDAICRAAIPIGLGALRDVVENDTAESWDALAWVSTCGGLALANAGLGAVHGFAGVIGGKTNAAHGEICGALLPAVLDSHTGKAQAGTDIHTRIAWVLTQIDTHFAQGRAGQGVAALRGWSTALGLRSLRDLGVNAGDHADIATLATGASSMKGNPFALTQTDLLQILRAAQ